MKAFYAAIIGGGFNNSRGALLGNAAMVGVMENLVGAYISPDYKDGVALLLFMVVIVFSPARPASTRRGAPGLIKLRWAFRHRPSA